MSHSILQLRSVTKYYATHKAVDGISFDVPAQSIFGMLGPNGAGKTTTIRMITNILIPDSGEIVFDNASLTANSRELMGYMPEERGLYKKMKVFEQLLYLAQLKGMEKVAAKKSINEWLDKLRIADWANKNVQDLSKGMQQKIQFISTVAHNPRLIILDEPFSGLDPLNSELIKNEIYELRQKGTTVIFSTHRMEQVEEICEEIILINKGKLLLQGTVKDIRKQYKENKYHLAFEGNSPSLPPGIQYTTNADDASSLTIVLPNDYNSNELLQHIITQGVHITAFREILPSLNEIFIRSVEQSDLTA